MPPLIFRKGLDLKHEVAGALAESYHSPLVDSIKNNNYRYASGRLTIRLAREFGFCYGVDRAVDYAYQARKRFPDRPVLLTGAILVTINVWGDYLWPTIVIQDPAKITISAGVQQFVGSFGTNLSNGGAVFAAFVLATLPMFILVGFTMRYFVSGLTEGATKL